ncbi:MAG: hypothetical protein QW292_12035, partial [Candidatus Parvarchaeota archaeon]
GLPIESIRRNLKITRKRSRGERPYSVMKRTFRGDHTFVTILLGMGSGQCYCASVTIYSTCRH